jgi:hypothetical protein
MKAASTHSDDGSEAGDDGQPKRVLVQAGAKVPMPATTAVRSAFGLAGPRRTRKSGGRTTPLPLLDIVALKPQRMDKPPITRHGAAKGSRYDALFEGLKVGEMFAIDIPYQSSVRRVMVIKNKAGPQRFSIRVLSKAKFGLWRDA